MLRSTSKSLGNPGSQSWKRKGKAAVGRICSKRKVLSLEWKSEWVMSYHVKNLMDFLKNVSGNRLGWIYRNRAVSAKQPQNWPEINTRLRRKKANLKLTERRCGIESLYRDVTSERWGAPARRRDDCVHTATTDWVHQHTISAAAAAAATTHVQCV